MSNMFLLVQRIFFNPYFSAIGLFVVSLGWFTAFTFFDRKVVYIIFGIITLFVGFSFFYRARHPQ